MGHQTPSDSASVSCHSSLLDHNDAFAAGTSEGADLPYPFGKLDTVDQDDLRETAYEIFFTACRSSPGFGGRHSLSYYSSEGGSGGEGAASGPGSPGRANGVGMAVTSRIKRSLGLKMLRRSQSRRSSSMESSPSPPQFSNSVGGGGLASTLSPGRTKRPLTSAEIMRQQMKVTEISDNRLRKTLMRTLVGQMGRRAETIILPLELLRHLKPSEFNDSVEYHVWQKRQLGLLEAGLILHPAIPLEKSNKFAASLKDIIRACETKPMDTGKNSESMRTLCNCVVSLSWRSHGGGSNTTDTCHWADGFPLNVHIYVSLLRSIFDLKDESLVLDEVDELLELMKKTWTTLGINKPVHNLCFAWVLFRQFVVTGRCEVDLLCATLAMVSEVAVDARRAERETVYLKLLSSVLTSMKKWSEKRLLCYHSNFLNRSAELMENLLPLVFSAAKMLEEDVVGGGGGVAVVERERGGVTLDSRGNRADRYIRSSVKKAFAQLLENGKMNGMIFEVEEVTEALLELAKETEDLAHTERAIFSPILKNWHPISAGVAAVTLHTCYGTLLKQFLGGVSSLSNEAIAVLQRAGKLEKALVQMVVEDSVDCEDGGKATVREMVPYEVDSIILKLLRQWIQERLKKGQECIQRAKATETWNPKSKTEPYSQSGVDLMKFANETVEDFFGIPIGMSEDLVNNLANGLQKLFREYNTFVASCGSKQSYIPTLPPLTRCNRDSKFLSLWRRACNTGVVDTHLNGLNDGNHPRPSTSRGTQRLYIRLNTLHYLLSQLHSLDKTLCLSPRTVPSPRSNTRRTLSNSWSYFEQALSGIQSATQHVSEVAAYRLIFLDSSVVFYDTLYVGGVDNTRIRPALRIVKQNLTLLGAIVSDRAQPLALKEVMKASFEAFLLVLLAGGSSRIFSRSDCRTIEEDFDGLKRVFCSSCEGLVSEEVVERETETVEGVVGLMGESTDQLVEDFSIVACEASGIGILGADQQKLPMPPTTGRWNTSDPNTILRVLCHRNDRAANQFLKRTFQLAKRR